MWDPVFASLSPWPSPPCLSLMFLPLLRIPVIGLRSPPRSKLTLSQASYSHPQRLYFQTRSVSQGPEIGTWTACQGPALHMPHYSPQDTLPIWLCGPTYRLTLARVFSCGPGVAGSIKIQDPQHKAQARCTAPACHRSPPWGAAPALPLTGHPRAASLADLHPPCRGACLLFSTLTKPCPATGPLHLLSSFPGMFFHLSALNSVF